MNGQGDWKIHAWVIEAFSAHIKGSIEYNRGQLDDSRIGGAEVAPKEIGAGCHEVVLKVVLKQIKNHSKSNPIIPIILSTTIIINNNQQVIK